MSTLPSVVLDNVRIVDDPDVLSRPRRDIASPLGNRAIRLASESDLAFLHSLRNQTGSVTIAATPMVEISEDGSVLRLMANAGLPLSRDERSRNILLIGATGSGKTYHVGSAIFEATLRDTAESIVRLNLKGPKGTTEDARVVKAIRPNCPVFVYAPGDVERGIEFNPLEYARRHGMVGTLLRAIVGSQARGTDQSAFWEFLAERNLKLLLDEGRLLSLAEVEHILSDPSVLAEFAKDANNSRLSEYARFVKEAHNGMTSFADVGSRLNQFCGSEELRASMSWRCDVDFIALLRQRQPFVLIIECNESTFVQARYVVNLFITMLLESAMRVAEKASGSLPVPLNIMLDEFGVIPPLTDFAAKANLYRSRDVRFVAMVQSIQQLRAAYRAEADSLLAAFNTKIFLCSGLDIVDREYSSRLSGNIVVQEWRETQQLNAQGQWAAVSRTSQSTQRPLLSPEDLQFGCETEHGRLSVVFVVDRPPMLVYFTPAWKLPVFSTVLATQRTQSKKKRRRSRRRNTPDPWASGVTEPTDETPVVNEPVEESCLELIRKRDYEGAYRQALVEHEREKTQPKSSSDGW